MASLTIRRMDDDIKARLRLQAAAHGVSVEEEVRRILAGALAKPRATKRHFVDVITEMADELDVGGLELPPRTDSVNPATFD